MSWHANQIYAKPTAEVIAAFREDSFLADQLYHVDNLRGVRFDWSREMLLSKTPPEDRKHMRHDLPVDGLLVVSPEIYETGYDRKRPADAEFARHYRHNTAWADSQPGAKWRSILLQSDAEVFFPGELDPDGNSRHLVRFLKSVYSKTRQPLLYYRCDMWGGDIDDEIAWVIDGEECIYQYNDTDSFVLHRPDGSRTILGDLLQIAFQHVGLQLPTRYFALHESSFHWELYRM